MGTFGEGCILENTACLFNAKFILNLGVIIYVFLKFTFQIFLNYMRVCYEHLVSVTYYEFEIGKEAGSRSTVSVVLFRGV